MFLLMDQPENTLIAAQHILNDLVADLTPKDFHYPIACPSFVGSMVFFDRHLTLDVIPRNYTWSLEKGPFQNENSLPTSMFQGIC